MVSQTIRELREFWDEHRALITLMFMTPLIFCFYLASVKYYGFKTHHMDKNNTCGMTYMYRSIFIEDIDMKMGSNASHFPSYYALRVYNEGSHWLSRLDIEPHQIPVLFIPGSGGSQAQIRSIASVMQNKTEQRRPPFGFRFFALDFGEEITPRSGHILQRQTEFMLLAVSRLAQLAGGKKKIVLIGHSFGGTVAFGSMAKPTFDQKYVDMMIFLAAPLTSYPLSVDRKSYIYRKESLRNWKQNRNTELKNVGILTYSGGNADYLVHDSATKIEDTVHINAWTVEGTPSFGTDHQAILWCNGVVRQITRVLWRYGEQYKNDAVTGRDIVEEFVDEFNKEQTAIAQPELDGEARIPPVHLEAGWLNHYSWSMTQSFILDIYIGKMESVILFIRSECIAKVGLVRDVVNVKEVTVAEKKEIEAQLVISRSIHDDKRVKVILFHTKNSKDCLFYLELNQVQMYHFVEMIQKHYNQVLTAAFSTILTELILTTAPVIYRRTSFGVISILSLVLAIRIIFGNLDYIDANCFGVIIGFVVCRLLSVLVRVPMKWCGKDIECLYTFLDVKLQTKYVLLFLAFFLGIYFPDINTPLMFIILALVSNKMAFIYSLILLIPFSQLKFNTSYPSGYYDETKLSWDGMCYAAALTLSILTDVINRKFIHKWIGVFMLLSTVGFDVYQEEYVIEMMCGEKLMIFILINFVDWEPKEEEEMKVEHQQTMQKSTNKKKTPKKNASKSKKTN